MSKRIIVCDDSPIIHNLLEKALVKHGHTVCAHAYNGKEGFDLYQQHKPDIVFMDITMPVMDGLEALKAIKQADPTAKVIMLSAMGDEEVVSQAKASGVDIFLKKPFNEYKVVSALASLG